MEMILQNNHLPHPNTLQKRVDKAQYGLCSCHVDELLVELQKQTAHHSFYT
jgi:hypothetical protein